MRASGTRFMIVGLLTLLMTIPLFLAGAIIEDRDRYSEQTRASVGREWGGPQAVAGPVLYVPVEADVVRTERRDVPDAATGEITPRYVRVEAVEDRMPVLVLPETLDLDIATGTRIRARGIFEVPVYAAELAGAARFDPGRADSVLADGERLLWDQAELRVVLSDNSGLRGAVTMSADGTPLELEPASTGGGLRAALPDADQLAAVTFDLVVNGAQSLMVSPLGRTTNVAMRGDWPDPSFSGAFLPDEHAVTADGYAARWTVPHLARAVPQVSRGAGFEAPPAAFGTQFIQVNDFYQKAWRAARYGILFIGLTFLTVLLTERRDRPAHPVQYVLIGLVQSLFVLLMVAYAEQIGFQAAYLVSAGATVSLIALFGWMALGLGRRALVLLAELIVLYAVLYMILRSADLALLAGATLAFVALAATMILTRNERWWGESGQGGLLRRPIGPWGGLPRDASSLQGGPARSETTPAAPPDEAAPRFD